MGLLKVIAEDKVLETGLITLKGKICGKKTQEPWIIQGKLGTRTNGN
jgi:hypothetical protein